jgi:hypothetical protein
MRRLLAPLVLLSFLSLLSTSLVAPTPAAAEVAVPTLRMFYVADLDGPGRTGLYSRDVAGGPVRTVLASRAGLDLSWAQVSPNGRQIAYMLNDGHAQLWLINVDGSNNHRLKVLTDTYSFGVRWSPAGSKLIFSNPLTGEEVQILDPVTGRYAFIPGTPHFSNPIYDPSDTQYFFGNYQADPVYRGGISGEPALAKVAGTFNTAETPVVSPDGKTVGFSAVDIESGSDQRTNIWTARAGVLTAIATGAWNNHLTLGPDGSVYFEKAPGDQFTDIGDLWSVPLEGSAAPTQLTSTPDVDESYVSTAYVDTTAPTGVVGGLRASLNGSTPRLDWTSSADPDATEVSICRTAGAVPAGAPCSDPVYSGRGTSFTDRGLTLNGVYSYAVLTRDAAGNVAATGASLTLRAIAPPKVIIAQPTSLLTTERPFLVRWGSAQAQAGTSYRVTFSFKDRRTHQVHSFLPWRTTTSTYGIFGARNDPTAIAPGSVFYLRAQTHDDYGNNTVSSTNIGVVPFEQDYAVRSKGWVPEYNDYRWLGGIEGSTVKGALMSQNFTGSSFALIGERCVTCGQLRVLVNGVVKAVVDTHASRYPRQTLVTLHFGSTAQRTIRIQVVGTAGHPRVNIDGFASWE